MALNQVHTSSVACSNQTTATNLMLVALGGVSAQTALGDTPVFLCHPAPFAEVTKLPPEKILYFSSLVFHLAEYSPLAMVRLGSSATFPEADAAVLGCSHAFIPTGCTASCVTTSATSYALIPPCTVVHIALIPPCTVVQ